MFSFLKNWINKERGETRSIDELKLDIQEESIVEAAKLSSSEAEVAAETTAEKTKSLEKIRTELSLHPAWEQQLDAEKKYTLRFLQAELPEMIKGTVGVTGFSLMPQESGVMVALFFRNGTDQPARFKNIGLSIYLDDKPFARHRFDLSEVGAIPPRSSRPWEVFFPADSFLHDNFTFTRWKVVMNFGKRQYVWPNHLDLDPEMEARMTERQKDRLEAIVQSLPPIKTNSVEITGFDIGKTQDGRLVAGLLFRNGLAADYQPQKLKINITDMAGDVVASGTVDTGKVRVRPGTSRPWLIVFPASAVKKPDADLRKWLLEVREVQA
jgi:accessory Sec system S-layer assembly protein